MDTPASIPGPGGEVTVPVPLSSLSKEGQGQTMDRPASRPGPGGEVTVPVLHQASAGRGQGQTANGSGSER